MLRWSSVFAQLQVRSFVLWCVYSYQCKGCTVAQVPVDLCLSLESVNIFALLTHAHTAIDGVTFKLKDETDTQQYLMQVSTTMHTAIMGNGWLHSCSIVQFALGQLKLLSLEDVESKVSSLHFPPTLTSLSRLSHSSAIHLPLSSTFSQTSDQPDSISNQILGCVLMMPFSPTNHSLIMTGMNGRRLHTGHDCDRCLWSCACHVLVMCLSCVVIVSIYE